MPKYIELDQKKLNQLKREAQHFQDDIVCAIGTDFMQKIAEAENRMLFDILKGIENDPPADVVPRSEVERLEKQLDDKQFRCDSCDRIALTSAGHKHCIKQAKQEVAKEMFEEIEKDLNSLIAYYKEKRKYVTEVEYNEFEQLFCDIKIRTFEERLLKITELKKKYIGKDTDVPTNIGETK